MRLMFEHESKADHPRNQVFTDEQNTSCPESPIRFDTEQLSSEAMRPNRGAQVFHLYALRHEAAIPRARVIVSK